jgi:hypothetical protein
VNDMSSAFGGIFSMVSSCKDQVFGMLKPALDCTDPMLDLIRPTCGPLVDFCKNVVRSLETF